MLSNSEHDIRELKTKFKMSGDRIPIVNVKNVEVLHKADTKVNISEQNVVYNTLVRPNKIVKIRDKMQRKERYACFNYFFLSISISFALGLAIGIFLMGTAHKTVTVHRRYINDVTKESYTINSLKNADNRKDDESSEDINRFTKVTFTGNEEHKFKKDVYPKGMTEDMKDILKDNKKSHHRNPIVVIKNYTTQDVPNDKTVLYNNIYWGPEIENSLPSGYGAKSLEIWEKYIDQAEVVKMEAGCGRMQNRLVTFRDGLQACVRYRQNTDQIQGEIFSFYVGRVLELNNLAPSVVKIVDLKDKLWTNVANEIANAQWSTNRAVVITQYISSLESANIPDIFKPSNRHLNKYDVLHISVKENDTIAKGNILLEKLKSKKVAENDKVKNFDNLDLDLSEKTVKDFIELAQWSDLIIFDYLTANLDRIVNNLFNFQWNVNIMDGPAHNLARKMDSGLLLFLDNESGLLHGYRLLKKYNVYHRLMLDNLCVFRKNTVDSLRNVFEARNIGGVLSDLFHKKNNPVVRDVLPPLPEKNAKILHERIGKVLSQVEKCEQLFSYR